MLREGTRSGMLENFGLLFDSDWLIPCAQSWAFLAEQEECHNHCICPGEAEQVAYCMQKFNWSA